MSNAVGILALGLAAQGSGGGGGGEPAAYIKSASVANNELTLTRKDDTTLTYSPDVDKAYVDSAIEDVEAEIPSLDGYATENYVNNHHDSTKQDTLTAGTNISIVNNVISATGGGSEPAAYLKSASVSNNTLTLTNKDNTTVEFTPQGGGSAEGAVRYDQAQSLTTEQQMQARANQGLPYTTYSPVILKQNFYVSSDTSETGVYCYWSLDDTVYNTFAVAGTKFSITVANASSNPTASETIECEVVDPNDYIILTDVTDYEWFYPQTSTIYMAPQYIRIHKKNTSSSTDWSGSVVYVTVTYQSPTVSNKLNVNSIDSEVLNTIYYLPRISAGNYNSTIYLDDSATNKYNYSISIGSNKLGTYNICTLGHRNDNYSQYGSVVGFSNAQYGGVFTAGRNNENNQAGSSCIGNYLLNRDSCSVLGQYNVTTSKYSNSTQYHVGDIVEYNASAYQNQIYKCLQDTIGHAPSGSWSSNEYWEYITHPIYTLVLGNGSDSSNRSNAFTVDWSGNGDFAGTIGSNGSDYAEYFEWKDGNPDNEDRVGYLVTLDEDKLVLADADDDIIGIVAATPTVLGDTANMFWHGKYLRDDFGRIIKGEVEHTGERQKIDPETGEPMYDEDGNPIMEEYTYIVVEPLINPEYDPTKSYKNRHARPEWSVVGLLGKLYVRDDGTAVVNGYVTANNGIATNSAEKTNLRVLERVNDHIIRVLVK